MRYRKTISLSVLALVAGFGPGLAQTSLERVGAQGSVVIDEHGYCRKVNNSGPLAIAVPTRTAEEWSNGGASFVQNVSNMSEVSLEECGIGDNGAVPGASCSDAFITWSGTSNPSYSNGSCQAYALSNETSCARSASYGEVVHLKHSGKDDDRGWAYAQCIDGKWTVVDSDCRDLDSGSINEPWYGGEKDLLKYCQSGSGIQQPSYFYTSSYKNSVRSAIDQLKAEGAVQSVGVEQ